MHYFQFNIGDYASHTSRLTLIEDLAYRRMLDLYYLNEQPLNGCITDVARELGLSDHISEVTYVLSKFFTETKTGFSQKRIDLEIKKYKSNAKNKSLAGKASAKARAAKACSKVTGVEQVLNKSPTDVQQNINHKPLTINHKTKKEIHTSKDLYQQIADAWNDKFPELPQIIKLTQKRKSSINGCVNEMKSTEHDFSKIETWTGLFDYAKSLDFLMGRKTSWSMTFDFITTKSKLLKIIEGDYDNE